MRIIDGRHGYTLEFAHDPDAHRNEYEQEAARIMLGHAR